MEAFPLMALGGALAGILGSMMGIGGGFIIVPMLTILFHVPMHTAIAAGQVSVIATSSVAAAVYIRARVAHVRLGMILQVATTAGAIVGALITGRLNAAVLSAIFGIVLLYVAFRMVRSVATVDDPSITVETCTVRGWRFGMGSSVGGGVLSGLLGIGGGIITVPVCTLVMGVPMRISTATSTFVLGVTAVAGAFIHYSAGYMDVLVTGSTALGVLVGAMLGARIAAKIKASYLRMGFALLALYTAAVMIARALGV